VDGLLYPKNDYWSKMGLVVKSTPEND